MTMRSATSLLAATAVVIGALLLAIGCTSTNSTPPSATGTLLAGNLAATTPATAEVGDPVHITVPAVGIDAAVRPIVDNSDEIDPPTDVDAWWWTARGRPGSTDTVYLAGHTLDDGGGVFAPLGKVAPGAQVQLDTTTGARLYQVDATAAYDKSHLDSYDEVWAAVPGRLILVTCLLDAQGRPTHDNLLVYASLRS